MDVLVQCQFCRARLAFADPGTQRQGISDAALQGSADDLDTGHQRLCESFVLLDGAVAAARRAQASTPEAGPLGQPQQQAPQGHQHQQRGGMEESFLLVGTASLLRPPPGACRTGAALGGGSSDWGSGGTAASGAAPGGGGGVGQGTSAGTGSGEISASLAAGAAAAGAQEGAAGGQGSSAVARVPLDPVFDALNCVFQIAAEEAKVEHPLCLDCAEKVQREVEAQVRELRAEVSAYEAALAGLEADGTGAGGSQSGNPAAFDEDLMMDKLPRGGSSGTSIAGSGASGVPTTAAAAAAAGGGRGGGSGGVGLEAQLAEARRLEQQERDRMERAGQQLQAARQELEDATAAAAQLAALEDRYWLDYGEMMMQLTQHVEERDALLTRTELAQRQLEALRGVSVLSDVFHIWHDGPFGTISGFRLGRTPTLQVEWDEINAAWGQAVLLLHTMAQTCRLSFSYRLAPMGSYPRVADRKAVHDLFGPVSKLYCTQYDRAMTCYLTCLKEFALFAAQRDRLAGRRQVFELPYAIEGSDVGGLTIKLMFNKDARWTKALKYMLTDLKWCLEWVVANQQEQAADVTAGDGVSPSPGGGAPAQGDVGTAAAALHQQ